MAPSAFSDGLRKIGLKMYPRDLADPRVVNKSLFGNKSQSQRWNYLERSKKHICKAQKLFIYLPLKNMSVNDPGKIVFFKKKTNVFQAPSPVAHTFKSSQKEKNSCRQRHLASWVHKLGL